jgi:hypothetical protein
MQVISFPIPIDAAAVLVMGVGVFCWLWIVVDIIRLIRKTSIGEYTGFAWDPIAQESVPKTLKTQQHTYKQGFLVGLFFFGMGAFILIYTRIFVF